MDKIRYIDLFGDSFNFTIKNELKFKTVFGGFMTIICLIIFIIFGLIFGQDFLHKKNPKILQQVVYPDQYLPPERITKKNFVVPWRLVDGSRKTLKSDEFLFPKGFFFRYINNLTGNFDVDYKIANISQCSNENAQISEFNNKFNISQWNCFNWEEDNFTFGGFWDGNYTDYFYLQLDFCQQNSTFSTNDNCTKLDKILHQMNNDGLYFEVIYPIFYFVPDDLDNPLKITYKSYFFQMNLNSLKTDRLFFSHSFLYDDVGWFTEKILFYNELGGLEIKSDVSFYDYSNDYGKEDSSAIFYLILFYNNKHYYKYNRSYQKIQELGAILGGFMKLIFLFGQISSGIVSSMVKEDFLFSEFFDYDRKKLKEKKPNLEDFISKYFPTSIYRGVVQNEIRKSKIMDSQDINRSFPSPNTNGIINLSSSDRNITLRRMSFKLINTNLKLKLWRQRLKYGFCFLLKQKIRFSKGKGESEIDYDIIRSYLMKRMDVIFYIKILQKYENFIKLVLNSEQVQALNYLKIPNLADPNDLDQLKDKSLLKMDVVEGLRKYFHKKIESSSLDETDRKIMNIILPEIFI